MTVATAAVSSSTLSRREVLNGFAAGAVVIVAGRLAKTEVLAQSSARAAAINAYVAIAPDGKVILQCAHSEMGQGIITTFAAIIADELEADWSKCDVVFSPAAPAYRHPVHNWQFTGNAESIRSYHALIRRMGAAAREMLIAAAADRLRVPAAELVAREGMVRHAASGRAVSFGEIATAAAAKPVPAEPRVKPESEWRLVGGGRSLPRRDIPAKVDGSAVFGIDVKVPGMVHAAVASAPAIGGKIASIDEASVSGMAGVIKVVPLEGAVAIVAQHSRSRGRADPADRSTTPRSMPAIATPWQRMPAGRKRRSTATRRRCLPLRATWLRPSTARHGLRTRQWNR